MHPLAKLTYTLYTIYKLYVLSNSNDILFLRKVVCTVANKHYKHEYSA